MAQCAPVHTACRYAAACPSVSPSAVAHPCAPRCDGRCTALRRPMQRAAQPHAAYCVFRGKVLVKTGERAARLPPASLFRHLKRPQGTGPPFSPFAEKPSPCHRKTVVFPSHFVVFAMKPRKTTRKTTPLGAQNGSFAIISTKFYTYEESYYSHPPLALPDGCSGTGIPLCGGPGRSRPPCV